MRLPDNQIRYALGRVLVTTMIAAGLAGCSAGGSLPPVNVIAEPVSGPRADYPVLVGDAFVVDGVTFTPADTLNYDEVGYLAEETGEMGYTAAHHTLPVPSYVEVTSLDSGRTVLVRIEQRGPMDSTDLLALSPAASAQLGGSAGTPIRVRRVNPPEEQRALLRTRNAAPLRMDTPMSLVTVLQRRLPPAGVASLNPENAPTRELESVDVAASTAVPMPALEAVPVDGPEVELPQMAVAAPQSDIAAIEPAAEPAAELAQVSPPEPDRIEAVFADLEEHFAVIEAPTLTESIAEPTPSPATAVPVEIVAEGAFSVQAASFANPDNARRAANTLGGTVSRSGDYYRVRTGPFATRGEAEASLANVRAAGYSDARILTSG